jgi:hypothetical protein
LSLSPLGEQTLNTGDTMYFNTNDAPALQHQKQINAKKYNFVKSLTHQAEGQFAYYWLIEGLKPDDARACLSVHQKTSLRAIKSVFQKAKDFGLALEDLAQKDNELDCFHKTFRLPQRISNEMEELLCA